ncbi:MAG: glycosyltransferase [Dysgonomonas sp.]|nr:glycosyltransferase [Dysgonomonas sp.]
MNNLCCIFNFAAHYRSSIYHLIDDELKADFYIGDSVGQLKAMNYHSLKGYKRSLKNVHLFYLFNWQKGAITTVFKHYQHYLITGDFFCLSTWIVLLLCKVMQKHTYLWTHGWYGREGRIKKWVKRVFFNLSSEVLLYGEYARGLMIKEGFNSQKLHCIANSLDYDTQLKIRNDLKKTNIYKEHFKNNHPNLIFVGRITQIKRIDMLIEAIVCLQKQGIPVNLTLVGDPMPEFDIKSFLKNRKLENHVWLCGACYDEHRLGEYFYNADACVSPGNVGLTSIHAFSYGCPVITHNNFSMQMPEFEIIKNGVNGAFYEYDNLDSLTDTIHRWIEYAHDKKNNIHKNCYNIIDSKFNPHYQIALLKKIINKS